MPARAEVKKNLRIVKADLDNPKHASDIVEIVDLFARDPMGQNQPLEKEVIENMVDEMKKVPTTMTYIAYLNDKAVGIVTCFIGFSTFTASKVFKIHDVAVHPDARGMGIGTRMLIKIGEEARNLGCAKVTLEVREDNPARRLYEKLGFQYGDPKWFFMTADLD